MAYFFKYRFSYLDVLATLVISMSGVVLVGLENSGSKFNVQAANDNTLSPGQVMVMECADGNPLSLNRLTGGKVRIRCGERTVPVQFEY